MGDEGVQKERDAVREEWREKQGGGGGGWTRRRRENIDVNHFERGLKPLADLRSRLKQGGDFSVSLERSRGGGARKKGERKSETDTFFREMS